MAKIHFFLLEMNNNDLSMPITFQVNTTFFYYIEKKKDRELPNKGQVDYRISQVFESSCGYHKNNNKCIMVMKSI